VVEDSLSSWSINKSVSCMKDAQIVYILNISLLKIQGQTKSFCQEMKCIKSFGLGFSNWRDIKTSREIEESSETSTCVLDHDSLRTFCVCRCIMEKGFSRGLRRISIAIHISTYLVFFNENSPVGNPIFR